MTYRLPAEV